MKAIQFILPLMMISKIMLGQEIKLEAAPLPVDAIAPEEEVLTFVEQMPEFPGGQSALIKYLSSNIQYPETCRKMGVEGKVFIKFVIDKEGIINQVAVLRGISDCNLLEKEALRVVRSMPKWTPGKQNGKAVNVYFTLPISFKLSYETEAK
jgi:protein TonB